MRSTAPIARGLSAPCGRCTSRRPSKGSSRSWPRPVPPRRAATSWPRWCASITARRIIKEAGGESGPTRPARTSIPREWECSGRIASVLKAAVLDGDAETVTFLRGELARRRVRLEGLPADSAADSPQGRGGDPRRHRQGRPEEPGPDRQHVLRGRGAAGTPGEGGCGARQGPLRRPVVPRLPHRRRRPDAQGAAPGGYRQALQPRGARGVDPEAERQDCSGVRGLRLRDGRRPGLHGLRRRARGPRPCRSASRRAPCTS